MIDYIIIAVILASLGFILVRRIKAKKAGQSLGCGCSCGSCPSTSACHGDKVN